MNKMTREEAIKAFKNCKFFVESPEKSAAAQKVLFSLGFKWRDDHTTPINLDEACLIVDDGIIYWGKLLSWSQEEKPLVAVDDIINSYASRRVRKISKKFHDGQILFSPKHDCILVYRGTAPDGAILTDTYIYLSGRKLGDFGAEVTNGNGYTCDYQPANAEQRAKLEEVVTDVLQQVRERVQKLANIDFEEVEQKENGKGNEE